MLAADKQLRSARSFVDEITAERETERDEFGRETARLMELVAVRERERDEQALRRRQVRTEGGKEGRGWERGKEGR